ncbi:HEAT repeat domain-containing protein, partial [bacterium]|nr:HEAT repeat domain-containing protein [bacterium]
MKDSRPVRQVLLALAAVVVAAVTPAAAQEELHERIEGYFAQIRPHGLYGNERAAQALIALAPSLHTARPEFVAALSDAHMVVRWTAARVLGLIGPEAKEAVPALAQALPTSEWYAQVMVAWALSRMGPAAAEATPALVKVLQTSRDLWVKREAAMALGAIGPQAREALPVLTSLLKDANGFVRVAAATSLYQVGRDNGGFPVLLEALHDPYIVGPRV